MATVLRSRGAFTRLLNGKNGINMNNAIDLGTKTAPEVQLIPTVSKYSSYAKSPFVSKITEQYKYEIENKPPEWAYVQKLMPFETIPQVLKKDSYPSGWKPPQEEAKSFPYFITRTKNHEIPIYLNVTYRGNRKISKVKKIEGDIWLLNDEIKSFLRSKYKIHIETRVHELGKFIEVKGDYVIDLQEWVLSKGF